MKKIIIYGAGMLGRRLLNILPNKYVYCFVDGDENKIGNSINGVPILPISNISSEYDIIVAMYKIPIEVKIYLEKNQIKYYTYNIDPLAENSFFMKKDLVSYIDDSLIDRYYNEFDLLNSMFYEPIDDNWYRFDCCSEMTNNLIEAMKKEDDNKISHILSKVYVNRGMIFDERYECRPGLRLIYGILKNQIPTQAKICDIACGNADLLKRLQNEYEVHGIDSSDFRVNQNKSMNIIHGDVENMPFLSNYFDAVICCECLEHVKNAINVKKEILRILKPGGLGFITVPFGRNCDSYTHVRQFSANKLYSLFYTEFQIINIMIIPYLNTTSNDNLFIVLRKKESTI